MDSVPEVQVGRWVQDSVLLQYIQVGAGECTVTRGSRGCRTVYCTLYCYQRFRWVQDSVLYTVLLPKVQVGAGQCTVYCTLYCYQRFRWVQDSVLYTVLLPEVHVGGSYWGEGR